MTTRIIFAGSGGQGVQISPASRWLKQECTWTKKRDVPSLLQVPKCAAEHRTAPLLSRTRK